MRVFLFCVTSFSSFKHSIYKPKTQNMMKNFILLAVCFMFSLAVMAQPPDPYHADRALINSLFLPAVNIDVNILDVTYTTVPVSAFYNACVAACADPGGPIPAMYYTGYSPYILTVDAAIPTYTEYDRLCSQLNYNIAAPVRKAHISTQVVQRE